MLISSENNMNRMRLGPGKHLHGQELMGGVVKGEDFDYFQFVDCHHVCAS